MSQVPQGRSSSSCRPADRRLNFAVVLLEEARHRVSQVVDAGEAANDFRLRISPRELQWCHAGCRGRLLSSCVRRSCCRCAVL